jgi:hypothetical protein
LSVVKKEAIAARVSGGHPGMCVSTYACSVLGEIVAMSV